MGGGVLYEFGSQKYIGNKVVFNVNIINKSMLMVVKIFGWLVFVICCERFVMLRVFVMVYK